MPCYHPLQASFSVRGDGKKDLVFNTYGANESARAFVEGRKINLVSNTICIPCGKCMGCRLERSRQWAVRCVHEASLYEDNCFLTLTYNDENLPVDGSLNKKELPLFMKKLRQEFSDVRIRYFACGEYGDRVGRPHYHACIFNLDFKDKVYWKTVNGEKLYTSEKLNRLWGLGYCVIGTLTFESAAYVARYCTKKVTGDVAKDHYFGRQPEFSLQSNRPGIGGLWYDKWKRDCFPSGYLVVNGAKCKPPRYYDKLLEREDPSLFEKIKQSRLEAAIDDLDSTHARLLDREKCQEVRFKKLIRTIERSFV